MGSSDTNLTDRSSFDFYNDQTTHKDTNVHDVSIKDAPVSDNTSADLKLPDQMPSDADRWNNPGKRQMGDVVLVLVRAGLSEERAKFAANGVQAAG